MQSWIIYFNPKCGTCRKVVETVQARGIPTTLIEYLKTPPTAKELSAVLKKGNLSAQSIVRKKEPLYAELGLAEKNLSDAALIEILVANPILIERPLVVTESTAILARPAETIEALLPPSLK